jgi:thiamine transport system permease protein
MILVFLFDFTSFGVILLLGGPGFATLEVEVFTQAMALFNLPLASILAFIQLICTLVLTLVYQYFSSKPVPLVPAAEKASSAPPTRVGQRVFVATIVIILLLLILTPLVSLVARSFIRVDADRGERVGIPSGFTLDYYQALSSNPRQDYFYIPPVTAIWNSVKYGVITALLSLILGLMIVYGFKRNKNHSGIFDTLLMIPLGTSAVTLGLGYIIFFNKPPFLWGASQWLIPMAHTLVALPFVVRGLIPAVGSIPVSYRQSAAILGASPWKVIRSIDLPIIRNALISSLVFSFTISLGEFGATSFLSRPDFPTIPIAIFRFLSQPGGLNYGQAMAMSTILMLVCAIGIVFIEKTIFTVPETVN